MKILVLSKRQYTNKDLLDDQYGRLWEIPFNLASMGHEIKGVCLSYRKRNVGKDLDQSIEGVHIEWYSFNLLTGFIKYLKCLKSLICNFKPDIILASSDCFHIIWGVVLGKIFKTPCIVDLYDNYETFMLSRITLIKPLYRYALNKADAISCVSKPLAEYVIDNCKPKGKIEIIGNAINKDLFFPRTMYECRKYFKLSENIQIIGTAGHLNEIRGISNLYFAFKELSKTNPNLYLALVGVGPREDAIFQHPNVLDLGVLPYEEIPFFFSMLNVAVICNLKNDFGQFCYPQKAYEIIACKTPLIAANVGVMAELLKDKKDCLFDPGDWRDLAEKIDRQLIVSSILDIPYSTWAAQAEKMERLMKTVIH